MHKNIQIHKDTCTYLHAHTHMCKHVHMHTHSTYLHAHTHIDSHPFTYTRTLTHIHIHICPHTHCIYLHAYFHTHVHPHTCRVLRGNAEKKTDWYKEEKEQLEGARWGKQLGALQESRELTGRSPESMIKLVRLAKGRLPLLLSPIMTPWHRNECPELIHSCSDSYPRACHPTSLCLPELTSSIMLEYQEPAAKPRVISQSGSVGPWCFHSESS